MLEIVRPWTEFYNTSSLLDPNNNVLLDNLTGSAGTSASGEQIILTTAFTFGLVAVITLAICAVYRIKSKKADK